MTIRKPFFVVPLDLGTPAAQNSTAGFPVTHLNRPRDIGLVWKTTSTMWARGTFGSTKEVDFCALMGTNAQSGTNIRLRLGTSQSQVDGTAPYDSTALPLIYSGTLSPSGKYHSHLELPAVENASWWRIDITGHSGTFEAMTLVLGKRLEPTYFYNTDFEYGTEALGTFDLTRLGVTDIEPGITLRTMGFTLSWMTRDEWETKFRPFVEQLGKTGVAYLCFDPEENIYRQNNTFLGPMKKWPVARGLIKPGFFSSEWTIQSLI